MKTTPQDQLTRESVAKTLALDQPATRRTRLKRWLVWLLPLAVVVAGAAAWASSRGATPVRYLTEPAKRGDLRLHVTATGNLQPTNEVDVGSELSGLIKTVEVDSDDVVRVGQVLARLDTTKLQAQALQSEAMVDSARAKLRQAQATTEESRSQLARLERVRELSGGKVPSEQDLEAARATLKRAEADEASAVAAVAQAQATLDGNHTDLSKLVIRSPINGIVLTREMEPGQTVAASFNAPVLFTLAEDLTKMELLVNVDEADVSQVKVGQAATFTVDGYPDRTFEASITKVSFGSKTVDGVVTYETVLRVDNKNLLLRPGMTATADITVRTVENAVLVPNAALRFTMPTTTEDTASTNGRGGLLGSLMPRPPDDQSNANKDVDTGSKQQRVWVLQEGKPVPFSITVGATDGTMTELAEGNLAAGAALIVDTETEGK